MSYMILLMIHCRYSTSHEICIGTEMEMLSFWWNFHHWLHWKLSKWQLPVQSMMKISSKWWHLCLNVVQIVLWFGTGGFNPYCSGLFHYIGLILASYWSVMVCSQGLISWAWHPSSCSHGICLITACPWGTIVVSISDGERGWKIQ